MKTFIHTLAVLSALAAATPTLAHPSHAYSRHAYPTRAQEFNAIDPRFSPREEATPALPFGEGGDSHDTATGGPVGGLGS